MYRSSLRCFLICIKTTDFTCNAAMWNRQSQECTMAHVTYTMDMFSGPNSMKMAVLKGAVPEKGRLFQIPYKQHISPPVLIFFCDSVVLESTCYRARASRLIIENNTTGWQFFYGQVYTTLCSSTHSGHER